MRQLSLFTTIFFLLASCKSTKPAQTNPGIPETDITGKHWKLTELMGKPVTNPPVGQKEAYFQLVKEGNQVQGNGSCNGFGGTYTLDPSAMRISFSKMRSTMMACPDMSLETELLKVFETADNYAVRDGELSLNKARMAPLARFTAVK